MFRKFGNSFFRIQHAQIRLDDISEHFYQKMHSHVAFCVISSSLYTKLGWLNLTNLILSLVISRLDYCNSLLNGVPDYKRIQRMQNIAARIVSRCPYKDHITLVLESLHWLPVKYRILFKLLLLTYKCLNGLGPGYLSCLVMLRKHRYEPRPQYQGQLQVPEARLKS